MRFGGLLLCVCLGACGPGPSVNEAEQAPPPEVPSEEGGNIPSPVDPAPPQNAPTGGVHQWTRELSADGSFWKSKVALNDAGLTGLLAALALPTEPEMRELSTIELVGWDLEGHQQWRRRVPGRAPNDLDYFPWSYEVMPHGAGFFVINSRERSAWGSNIDFGCTEVQGSRQHYDRLLLIDERGTCTRSLGIEYFINGATSRGDDFWISRGCFGCAGLQWPPLQQLDARGNVVLERKTAVQPARELRPASGDTLLGWGDRELSRLSESFDVHWKQTLPIWILAAPVELPDGQLAVIGARLNGQGFSFGGSIIPDGHDLVLLRLSARGEPLGALGTDVPEPHYADNWLTFATDPAGIVVVKTGSGTQVPSVLALSWDGAAQWTRDLEAWAPGSCLLSVSSVASHPRHGVRVAGVLRGQRTEDGTCRETRERQRSFVVAFSR